MFKLSDSFLSLLHLAVEPHWVFKSFFFPVFKLPLVFFALYISLLRFSLFKCWDCLFYHLLQVWCILLPEAFFGWLIKYLPDNSNLCAISILASVYFLLPLKLIILVCQVIFFFTIKLDTLDLWFLQAFSDVLLCKEEGQHKSRLTTGSLIDIQFEERLFCYCWLGMRVLTSLWAS